MPPRNTPTVRQRRIGSELRKLRERAGLSTREAGELLGVNPARVSSIEAGRFGVSADRIRMFAHNYGCTDGAYVEALAAMTQGRSRHWWDEYRGMLPSLFLDLAEVEYHAAAIQTTQISHLPGLLQTVDYARVAFRQNIPTPSPPQVEHLISHRIKRQSVLYRERPIPVRTVIHEAALRMRFGGPDVTREQLRHLVECGSLPHVTVRVVPFSAGIFPGAGQTVCYLEGPVSQLDTVQLDAEHGSVFLDTDADLERYRIFMERFEETALDEGSSRELIESIIDRL